MSTLALLCVKHTPPTGITFDTPVLRVFSTTTISLARFLFTLSLPLCVHTLPFLIEIQGESVEVVSSRAAGGKGRAYSSLGGCEHYPETDQR